MKQVTLDDALAAGRALGALDAHVARFEMEHKQTDWLMEQTEMLRNAAKEVSRVFGLVVSPLTYVIGVDPAAGFSDSVAAMYRGANWQSSSPYAPRDASTACNARNASAETGVTE